jgi:hypothetical protein
MWWGKASFPLKLEIDLEYSRCELISPQHHQRGLAFWIEGCTIMNVVTQGLAA